jgi:hypothetical protein
VTQVLPHAAQAIWMAMLPPEAALWPENKGGSNEQSPGDGSSMHGCRARPARRSSVLRRTRLPTAKLAAQGLALKRPDLALGLSYRPHPR